MPSATWAELVDGVVHMPSPLFEDHAGADLLAGYWIGHYLRFTPGVWGGTNVSTLLGDRSEVQPDLQLRIPTEAGGATQVVGGYVQGAPELTIEVARSSRAFDLGAKKREYERAGCREYLVLALDPNEVFWFVLREDAYVRLEPDARGWYRSEVFPGLWLDPRAFYANDWGGLHTALEQGLAAPEHAA